MNYTVGHLPLGHECGGMASIEKNKNKRKKMRERRNRFAMKDEENKCLVSFGCLHLHVDAYYNGVLLKEDNVVAWVVKLLI